MKRNGFALVELFIVLAILLILAAIIVSGFYRISGYHSTNISVGINGMTETRCINGYSFIIDQNGNARQILDEFGKGARCRGGE